MPVHSGPRIELWDVIRRWASGRGLQRGCRRVIQETEQAKSVEVVSPGVGGRFGARATSSLPKRLHRWRFTVGTPMKSASAISRLERPAATRRKTSTSRRVRPCSAASPAGAVDTNGDSSAARNVRASSSAASGVHGLTRRPGRGEPLFAECRAGRGHRPFEGGARGKQKRLSQRKGPDRRRAEQAGCHLGEAAAGREDRDAGRAIRRVPRGSPAACPCAKASAKAATAPAVSPRSQAMSPRVCRAEAAKSGLPVVRAGPRPLRSVSSPASGHLGRRPRCRARCARYGDVGLVSEFAEALSTTARCTALPPRIGRDAPTPARAGAASSPRPSGCRASGWRPRGPAAAPPPAAAARAHLRPEYWPAFRLDPTPALGRRPESRCRASDPAPTTRRPSPMLPSGVQSGKSRVARRRYRSTSPDSIEPGKGCAQVVALGVDQADPFRRRGPSWRRRHGFHHRIVVIRHAAAAPGSPRRWPPVAPGRTRGPSPASGSGISRPVPPRAAAGSCPPARRSPRRAPRRDRPARPPRPRRPPACSRRRRPPAGGRAICSSGVSRSWLQAMVSRIVCCRAGRSRPPPVSRGNRFSSRASSTDGGATLMRAAASSIASGRPSRRRQISATVGAFSAVRTKSSLSARAARRTGAPPPIGPRPRRWASRAPSRPSAAPGARVRRRGAAASGS